MKGKRKAPPKKLPFNPTDPKAWARRPQNSPASIARARAAKMLKAARSQPERPTIVQSVAEEMGHGDDSPTQLAILKAVYGLSLSDEELGIWQRSTGRSTYPARSFPELSLCTGAQSGKTGRVAAPIAVFEAIHGGHERLIKQGEPVCVLLVSTDQDSARTAFGYIAAILDRPAFKGKVARVLADTILLKSGIEIQCVPSTKTAPRGRMICAAVCDEIAFWRLHGAVNSDVEIVTAIRRGQILIPGAKLIRISTAYSQQGVLYEDFQNHFGKDSPDVLCWKSTTSEMNPSVTPELLDRMRRTMTPMQYRREFEGEFAADFSQFLSDAWVSAADSGQALDLPRIGALKYVAGVDASGGGADAFALSISHRDGAVVVQDVVRSWSKPRGGSVDLEGIVGEIAHLCKGYGIGKVSGDRYSAQWVVQAFQRHGITYANPVRRERDGTETYLDRSMCYLEAEQLFATGKLQLRSDERTLREFRLLERRPGQGRDRVDHPKGGSDDRANATAISAVMARGVGGLPRPFGGDIAKLGSMGSRFDPPVEPAKPGEEASACCGSKVDRAFFADGICSSCSRRNPGVLAPGAQPSRPVGDGPVPIHVDRARRASRGVATGWGGRVAGQAAHVISRYDWRRR